MSLKEKAKTIYELCEHLQKQESHTVRYPEDYKWVRLEDLNETTKQIQELLKELPILKNHKGEPWVNPEKAAILVIKLKEILNGEEK